MNVVTPSHAICIKRDDASMYSFMIKFGTKMAEIKVNPPIYRINIKFPRLSSLIKKST